MSADMNYFQPDHTDPRPIRKPKPAVTVTFSLENTNDLPNSTVLLICVALDDTIEQLTATLNEALKDQEHWLVTQTTNELSGIVHFRDTITRKVRGLAPYYPNIYQSWIDLELINPNE